MSHNVEKMMFTGKKPWWYGNSAQQDAVGVDLGQNAVTSEVAMKEAGLDWDVIMAPAGIQTSVDIDNKPVYQRAPGECFLARSSDMSILGRCKDGYKPFQNAEGFAFMDSLVSDGDLLYHTAGSLEGGKRVWILAQTPTSWTIKRRSGREDHHYAFLLAMLGHDGKHGINLMATDVRAECANTCGFADSKAETDNLVFRITHSGNIEAKLKLAASAIEVISQEAVERRAMLQAFAQAAMSTDDFMDFAIEVFLGLNGDAQTISEAREKFYTEASDRQKTIMENKVGDVTRLFLEGQGNEGDSMTDALNGFTEYFDHFDIEAQKSKIDRGIRAARAVQSSWVGAGAKMKGLAWKRLKARIER